MEIEPTAFGNEEQPTINIPTEHRALFWFLASDLRLAFRNPHAELRYGYQCDPAVDRKFFSDILSPSQVHMYKA